MNVDRTSEWKDVNIVRNFSLLLLACKHTGLDPQLVLEHIPVEYNCSVTAEDVQQLSTKALVQKLQQQLQGKWISLAEYNKALHAVRDALGHSWHVREAGHHSKHVHFGVEAVKRLVLKAGLRWLSTPIDGYRSISQAASFWNRNKWWAAHQSGFTKVLLTFGYESGPQGKRSILEDFESLRLIAGIHEVLVQAWGNRPKARVRYKMLPISITDIMHYESPSLDPQIKDGVFTIDAGGERVECGNQVWVKPVQRPAGRFIHYAKTYEVYKNQIDGSIPAIRLTKDIETVCGTCEEGDNFHPMYHEGEMYQLSDVMPFPYGTLEVEWRPHFSDFLRRALLFLNPSSYIQEYVSLEHNTEHALREAHVSQSELRRTEDKLAHHFPTREIALQAREGRFGESGMQRHKDCIIQVDIANSMAASMRVSEEEWSAGMKRALLRTSELGDKYGIWLYRTTGDGFVGIASTHFGAVGAQPADLSDEQMIDNVLAYSVQLHDIFREELDVALRIGIDYGETVWTLQSNPMQIDGAGLPLNYSARLESACEEGRVYVSQSVMQLGGDRHRWTDLGEMQVKNNVVHAVRYEGTTT